MKHLKKNNKTAWITVAIASLLYVYDYLVRVGPGVLVNESVNITGLSQQEIILINSFFYYGYSFMQIPAGVLIDHFGPKKMLIFGALCAGSCMLLTPCVDGFWALALLRALCGASVSFAYIAPLVYAHYNLEKKYFAMIGGGIQLFGSVGAIVGTLPISLLMTAYGWPVTNIIVGCTGFFCAALFIGLTHAPAHQNRSFKDEWIGLKHITKHVYTWCFGALGLILWSPMLVLAENLGVPYLEAKSIPNAKASLFILTMWLCSGLAGPFMGYWSYGSIKSRFNVINIGLILSFTGVMCFIYLPAFVPWIWVIFSVIIGAGSATQCVVFGLINDITSEDFLATAIGFQNMCIALSGLTILPTISWLSYHIPHFHRHSIGLIQIFQESMLVLPFVLIVGYIISKSCQKILT